MDQAELCRSANDCLSEVQAEMKGKRGARQERGFTIMQMVVVITIIALVSAFGVLGIVDARAEFRLQSSARLFATYIEKARADAIRRHAPDGSNSSVETFGPGSTTYTVTMDFGSGTLETRTYPLQSGLVFMTDAKKVSFDWRGRISGAWVFQVYSQYLDRSLPVDVSGSGDITVGEQHFPDQLIPPVEVSQVTGDVQAVPTPTPTATPTATPSPDASPTATPVASPTATPNGNGNGSGTNNGNGSGSNSGNGNGNPTPTPTPTPTPSGSPSPTPTPMPQCIGTVSPSTLSLSQSNTGNQTGTATFTMTNATGVRTLSATQSGGGNSLVIGLSLSRLEGNGSSIVTVTTKHGAGNRGVFVVDIAASPGCGSTTKLTVSVSN